MLQRAKGVSPLVDKKEVQGPQKMSRGWGSKLIREGITLILVEGTEIWLSIMQPSKAALREILANVCFVSQ